jgi:hypothetical protein
MRQLLIIPSVLFAFLLSAHATSVELPVTPSQLDQQNYKFAVTANATNNAVTFHLVITAKQSEIPSDSEGNLAVVIHAKDGKGSRLGTDIKPFQPTVPIALNKDKHAWTADFTLPREALKTPGLCFIFSELAHTVVNGKPVAMPSITFYEIKLKDFVKQ